MSENIATRSRARTFMLWLAGLLVALLAVGGISAPAFAAGGKVTIWPTASGTTHNGNAVLNEGGTYSFQLGYGSMDDGQVVAITLPEGISIPTAVLTVPTGNTAVTSLALNDAGQLIVTFADPFPADVNQGVLDLQFTLDAVESSEVRDLVWNVDGEETHQTVIVTDAGDSPRPTSTSSSKSVGAASFPHTVVDGVVVIDESVLGTEIPYTITISSKDARAVDVADTLGANLEYVEGSLAGTRTIRDENDLNPSSINLGALPQISGDSFSFTLAAEANSVYTFTYKAKIKDAAALENIRTQLQDAYDAVDKVNGGNYSVALTNSVIINAETRTTSTRIGGTVQGLERPGTGTAFSKTADPTSVTLAEGLAAGSTLADGIPVTYTLGADLTVFADFADGPFALDRNVVIRDTLSDQISWNTEDADFLVLTDADGEEITLSPAAGLAGNAEQAIAADEFVNTYVVNGASLYINIGKDVTQAYTLKAKATIDSLPAWASNETQYQTQYRADNNAYFVYDEGRYESKGASTTLIVPKDLSAGVDDPSKFAKSTAGGAITVTAGTSATVPYTFTIGAGVGDAASSRIIDAIDHSVFDVSEDTLARIKASISGTYDWNYPLDGDTFDVSIDADGNLVIAPNAEFPKDASWGASAQTPLTGTWTITVGIPTHVLQGKQTLDLVNSARYEGDDQEIVYTSSSSTSATSYGNEMEVRKRVYDAANDAFSSNLRVETDEDGALLEDEFVYRVELMPHGTFTNMVEDVVDVLPAGVEFVGFVAPGDVATGTTATGTTYTIPGTSLIADYDADANTVTLERGRLTSGTTVALYFKVRVVDHAANVGITNVIGSTGATITPTNDYPLSLLKRDSTDATKLITDSAARFSVLGSDQESVVLSDLRVVDGKIVTVDGATPVVAEPGTYWLREDVAPVGYQRASQLSEITVDASGSSADVVLYNTPGETVEPEKTYAIGDVVWIDADKDGVQEDSEQVLPGVTVELIQNGEVIRTATTDEFGRYLFDELPAGEYQVKFTLTEEQNEIYAFTTADAGDDDAVDSDADPETGLTQTIVLGPDNTRLTHDYGWGEVLATEGIDPTWDAGVIVRPTQPEEPGDADADAGAGADADAGAAADGSDADAAADGSDAGADGSDADAAADGSDAGADGSASDADADGSDADAAADGSDADAAADGSDADAAADGSDADAAADGSEADADGSDADAAADSAESAAGAAADAGADVDDSEVDPAHPGTPGVNELATTGASLPFGLAGLALVMLLAGASIFFWRRRTV